MRGTLHGSDRCGCDHGIIPAHAGNTAGQDAATVRRPGSSPRMRGTLFMHVDQFLHGGIIPAHAGNTLMSRPKRSLTWDHPRACGEHESLIIELVVVEGSSPRMRGTPTTTAVETLSRGIIPAHAGNTARRRVRWGTPWDHPRACGEHQRLYEGEVDFCGIIPAHAGNTLVPKATFPKERDHPRACGEHMNGD